MPENHFLLSAPAQAELLVQCQTSELMLPSEEIEEQTRISHLGKEMPLWDALRDITLGCFSRWEACGGSDREAFIREALAGKEQAAAAGEALVIAALQRPLLPQAIARVMLLGHNFLRTLDICLEALLRFPSQKSLTRKPLRTQVVIDWAVGGIREWACNYPYSFETASESGSQTKPQSALGTKRSTPATRLAHVSQHYATDRGARSQISHKQIANMFLLRDSTVADLERRGMAQLRTMLAGDALDPAHPE